MAVREQWSEEQYLAVRLTDCYIYGPSTRNIRVEGLWRQQSYTTTGTWVSYFAYLKDADVYRQWEPADRIVLLFVFMPIIRQELVTFVDTHNATMRIQSGVNGIVYTTSLASPTNSIIGGRVAASR
jgi:hypothetical protein